MKVQEVSVKHAVNANKINASMFLPFLIKRLSDDADSYQAKLAVTLLNVLEKPKVEQEILLKWDDDYATDFPVQESVVTEWAACGLACVLLPIFTPYQVLQVTQTGEGFDYWVGNEQMELGLEVSGTIDDSVWQRHFVKVKQYRDARSDIDGYVCIAGFGKKLAILSFHQWGT